MTTVHRLFTALATILLAVIVVPATGAVSAAVNPEPVHAYAYDSHHHPASLNRNITERGPPSSAYEYALYDAIDRWSHGALTRSGLGTWPSAYTYSDHTPPVQVARTTVTTGRQVQRTDGPPVVLQRRGVAAETGGLDLAAAEEAGGHTLARHVGMTDQALIDRNIPYASTFADQAAAESVTAQNISSNAGAITKWLAGSSPRLAIQDSMDSALGRLYERSTQTFLQPSGVNTVLVRTPTGYNVLTSYPTP